MFPQKIGWKSMQYTLWCEVFGKMRLDHIPAVLNNVIGRVCTTILFSIFFVLCRGEILYSNTGENWGSAVDYLLWPCGIKVGKMPVVYAHVLKVYPFWLWERGGNALWHGFCEVSCKFIMLTLWEWLPASFLSSSAQQFAPEMLFVAVKYILFLCFFF